MNIKKRFIIVIAMFLLVTTLVVACGKKQPAGSEPNVETEAIILSRSKVVLSVYEQYKLTASGVDDTVNWTSSDISVVTVDNGILTGCGVGNATVTASCNGAEASCKVTVLANTLVPIISGNLDRTNNIFFGNTYQLDFDGVLYNGTVYSVGFTYSSSDSDVVSVSNGGLVKAMAVGEAYITAKAQWNGSTIEESYLFNVIDNSKIINVERLNFRLYSAAIGSYSNTGKINAQLIYDGAIISGTLSYTSDDPTIAEVSDSGVITAKKPGNTIIRVTGSAGVIIFPTQSVIVTVDFPIITSDKIVTVKKTFASASIDASQVFSDDEVINKITRADTLEEIIYEEGKLSLTNLDYGYTELICYGENYGVKVTFYIAPPAGTLLYSSDSFGVKQITSTNVSVSYDSDVAWETEMGSLKVTNGLKAWISTVQYEIEDIAEFECIYFRIFAGNEDGGYIYSKDQKNSIKLNYGWNYIVVRKADFSAWYNQDSRTFGLGYTNSVWNNVPGNLIQPAWISNIYGVSKSALEDLIASLPETFTEQDAQRIEVILDFFSLISDKDVTGKEEFVTRLNIYDGVEQQPNTIVSSTARSALVQISTPCMMTFDNEFGYQTEGASVKIYNNNVAWVTKFSFYMDATLYDEFSFYIYVESVEGGRLYDKSSKDSSATLSLNQGWNKITINKTSYSMFCDEQGIFTFNYTSFRQNHTVQTAYGDSIWLSTVIAIKSV